MIILYTLSDVRDLCGETLASLKSLKKVVFTQAVRVEITPPYPSDDWINEVIDLGVQVVKRENETTPFKIRSGGRCARFGEKVATLKNSTEADVLFLDCDTRINQDPWTLFDEDFDFMARIAPSILYLDWSKWEKVFRDHTTNRIKPIFNAGVMAFRNHAAQEIGAAAMSVLQCYHFSQVSDFYQKDQFSISVALGLGDYRIKKMGPEIHAFRWLHESPNSMIVHGSKNVGREIVTTIRGLFYYVA